MHYTVQSHVITGMRVASERVAGPRLVRVLWALSWPLLAVFCYAGILCSFPVVGMLPLNVLSWLRIRPPSLLYWIVAILSIVALCGMACVAGLAFFRRWKSQCIDVEALLVVASTLLAVCMAAHFLPTGL
jgi:hypothetical protein